MFKLLELYVINNYRITEYVTHFGQRRFDIQPWRGEKELKMPVENSDGTWEAKIYPIQLFERAPLDFNG